MVSMLFFFALEICFLQNFVKFANMESIVSDIKGIILRVWKFYADGFRSMTVGRKLWALIVFKLIILFLVLKLFFFPDLLHQGYDTDEQRAEAVRSELTKQQNRGATEPGLKYTLKTDQN